MVPDIHNDQFLSKSIPIQSMFLFVDYCTTDGSSTETQNVFGINKFSQSSQTFFLALVCTYSYIDFDTFMWCFPRREVKQLMQIWDVKFTRK